MFGAVKTEERAGEDVITIKEGLIPIVNLTRLYALREGLQESSTIERLRLLRDRGVLPSLTYDRTVEAFEILWDFRFTNQILLHGEIRRVNDDLVLKGLSDTHRKRLRHALSAIPEIQQRLSFDFLGMDLS